MKHQWAIDDSGNVVPFAEDSEHPGYSCWMGGTTLDADDCEGLDLTAEVQVTIRHPGNATCYEDRFFVGQTVRIPLAQLADTDVDVVSARVFTNLPWTSIPGQPQMPTQRDGGLN